MKGRWFVSMLPIGLRGFVNTCFVWMRAPVTSSRLNFLCQNLLSPCRRSSAVHFLVCMGVLSQFLLWLKIITFGVSWIGSTLFRVCLHLFPASF